MRSEGFYVNENPLTPAGIETANFRFVAQLLETCIVSFQNKFDALVHLVGFTIETEVRAMCSEKLHLTETSLSGLRRSGFLRSVGW